MLTSASRTAPSCAADSTCSAEPACTVMVAMLCATVSCSSRAMRSRSSASSRAASDRCSSSASSSRRAVSAASARRLRTTSPSATARMKMTNDGRKSASTSTSGVPLRPTANRPATMMHRRHGDRQGQVSRHRHVVGRHEHQRGRRDVPAVHQVEEDHGGEGDQQHRARPAPVHEQRQRDDRAERPGQRVERRRARAAAHRHVQFDDRDHDGDRDQVAHADIQRPRLPVHVITVRGRLSPRKAAIPARKFLQKS